MLYIRADANPTIATGHIMRCMSIANEFRKHGEDTTFIIADKQPRELLKREKYKYICLNSTWNHLDSETERMIACIKKNNIMKLLIDTYYVTEHYLSQISANTKTIYIDDLASFIYPVDMLINYNNYYDKMHYEDDYKNKQTKLVLGCKYTPLREEFIEISPIIRSTVKKVLVTTGGADCFNIAGKLLSFIWNDRKDIDDLEFHVIVGKFNNNKEQLEQLSNEYHNIVLHYDVDRMSGVMIQCDLAISAGGSTMYELCACAVPMITYSFADNQIEGVKGFEKLGVAKYCGDIRDGEQNLWEKIYKAIKEYQDNNEYRKQIAIKMHNLIDAKGVTRLYEEIKLL